MVTAGGRVFRSFRYMMAYDEVEGERGPNNVLFLGIQLDLSSGGESLGHTPLSHVIISGCHVGIAYIDYPRDELHLLAKA